MTTTAPEETRPDRDTGAAGRHAADAPLARGGLRPWQLATGVAALFGACAAGIALGPVDLPLTEIARSGLDRLPFVDVPSSLSARDAAIVWDMRLPRVVLGGLVGAMLATAGAGYQGVFRNPLADPYLLGIAAGAGVGATLSFAYLPAISGWWIDPLPLAAFVGALAGVAATYLLSRSVGGERDTVSLILAGVAVAAFFTAVQTFVQQRESETLRQVYAWLLGRLSTTGWQEVVLILPYVVVASAVLLAHRRLLDVLSVGDSEAVALGVSASRVRLTVVVAASLGTAAAVAVSGLIGFVGIIVPHTVRLVTGAGYRSILPLSLLCGAAFLILADLLSRMLLAPAEVPIGVVTAFVGAPFFAWVLRHRRSR
jgi:iron complex transport system permease protein